MRTGLLKDSRRLRAIVGTVLFVLTPEVVVTVFHFWIGGSVRAIISEPESYGMLILLLSIHHAAHVPLYGCLCAYWYGIINRGAWIAAIGLVLLAPVAAATAHWFFTVSHLPRVINLIPGPLYLVAFLLLLNRDVFGASRQTKDLA